MNENYFAIIKRNRITKVNADDVFMIEQRGRKVLVHTETEIFDFYERMENVVQNIGFNFFRCMHGCYINLNHVVDVSNIGIKFDNGEIYSIGKANLAKVKHVFADYIKKSYENT